MKELTTNLTQLNHLYALHHEAVQADNADEASKAWINYYVYVRLYYKERGIPFTGQLQTDP